MRSFVGGFSRYVSPYLGYSVSTQASNLRCIDRVLVEHVSLYQT